MFRRDFLRYSGGILAAGALGPGFTLKALQSDKNTVSGAEMIKPNKLNPGDKIGIIAPGSAVSNPDSLLKAAEAAEYFGLKYELGKHVAEGSGYKTRTAGERMEDFNYMFENGDIKGVFCIRGGYGSMELLDKIDYGMIKKSPKVFLGYSDITALHLAINKFSGLVTFHGPVMLSAFEGYTAEYLEKALFQNKPAGKLENSSDRGPVREYFPVRQISPGKASGTITGGNLSLICALMGTPYEIETDGKILCIEDVGEPPYRIDRMLTQLKLAGKFDKAKGIAFGLCNSCGNTAPDTWDLSLGEALDKILGNLGIPVFYGLTFGHTKYQITIPFGVNAEIDAGNGTVTIKESAVT